MSLLDVLDRVLDRGIVVEASAAAALPSLDLGAGEGAVRVASRETVPAGGAGWESLAALVASTGAEREAAAGPEAAGAWRPDDHAALKRQFERLNA